MTTEEFNLAGTDYACFFSLHNVNPQNPRVVKNAPKVRGTESICIARHHLVEFERGPSGGRQDSFCRLALEGTDGAADLDLRIPVVARVGLSSVEVW